MCGKERATQNSPLHEGVRGLDAVVILEHRSDLGPDLNRLQRIPQQIADHSNVSGLGQLNQHNQIGALVGERRVDRVMGALPAVDHASAIDLDPTDVEALAAMTHPFRTPLERAAGIAALNPQLVASGAVPVTLVESITGRSGGRQSRSEI